MHALGLCGWALAGGTAMFAIWELGNFSVLIGNAPLHPAAVREEAPPSGAFRPAGESRDTGDGCTQAPSIGRAGRRRRRTATPGPRAATR